MYSTVQCTLLYQQTSVLGFYFKDVIIMLKVGVFFQKPFIKLWHGVPGHFWPDYPIQVEHMHSLVYSQLEISGTFY